MLSRMKKNGTTGQIVKTVVIIWFVHGAAFGKSGTDSGTGSLLVLYDNAISFPQANVTAQIRKKALPSFRGHCPALLSRTLSSESVVFIGCPAVPEIVRINSLSVRAEQNIPPDLARQARFWAGTAWRITDPQSGESPPGTPASRHVSGRDRKEYGREREKGVRRRKDSGFSPRFRRDFAGFISRQE